MCRYYDSLKTIVEEVTGFVPFFVGFTLKALHLASTLCLNCSCITDLLPCSSIVQMAKNVKASAVAVGDFDDDDEGRISKMATKNI